MTDNTLPPHDEDKHISLWPLLVLVFAAGTLFCTVHILNGWLFASLELTEHINFLYLPSFLRIMNVLVLGMLWGTAGTAVGGMLLLFWVQDSVLLSLFNIAVSAGSAALALWCMQIFLQRTLSLTRLADLLQLALLNALLNPLLHHLLWIYLDPSQLISPHQMVYMMMGDIYGAIVGALGLRWVATHSGFIHFVRKKFSSV